MPNGKTFLLLRAITFDGWLSWKHALSHDASDWHELDAAAVARITAMAQALHAVLDNTQASRLLGDSPYRVARWWNPPSQDPIWDGGRVLLRRSDLTAQQLIDRISATEQLRGVPVTQSWAELQLTTPSAD